MDDGNNKSMASQRPKNAQKIGEDFWWVDMQQNSGDGGLMAGWGWIWW